MIHGKSVRFRRGYEKWARRRELLDWLGYAGVAAVLAIIAFRICWG